MSPAAMLPNIPNPADYDVSTQTGFLPSELPLEVLSNPYYATWESIGTNLNGYILARRLRGVVDEMPILSTVQLKTEPEWRRANSLLSFIVHAYIWGGDTPAEIIPPSLSIPYLATCSHLELPPVATYAAVCLWNYKQLFPEERNNLSLSNLATLQTFTGSTDESWFYLVSVAIEAAAGPCIVLMLDAIRAARMNNRKEIVWRLYAFAEKLEELRHILERMYENLDSQIFYHRLRPYLTGSKNAPGLPNGVCFDTGVGKREFVHYSGGSNAQSSVIQFFDLVLGIEHLPTGETRSPKDTLEGAPSDNFIHTMRQYMPGPHRRFLTHVAAVANIRDFVNARPADDELVVGFNSCLKMLTMFRDTHMQIVSRYIIIKAHETKVNIPQEDAKSATARSGEKKPLRGTGGTDLMAFLKQARDETRCPAVGQRAQMMMSREYAKEQKKNGFERGARERTFVPLKEVEKEQSKGVEIRGLAAIWTDEDAGGGICHW